MAVYLFSQLTDEEARGTSGWRYEPPYDFYDATGDEDDLADLLDPERRKDTYFSAFDEGGALVGFFQFDVEGATVDVGLGLRPDLTAGGLGLDYLLAGFEFARERYSPARFTLAVATFNERAIRVYERAGFRRQSVYMRRTNGGEFVFLAMARGVRDGRASGSRRLRGYAPTTEPSAKRMNMAARTRPLSAVPRAEKSLLRVRWIRPATPSPSPMTYRIRQPKTPMPIRARLAKAGEFRTLSGSRLCGSTFSNAEVATTVPATKSAKSTTVARIARTNEATPILECAFSLVAPAPVSYVNFSPYSGTAPPAADRVSESMVAHGGGQSRRSGMGS